MNNSYCTIFQMQEELDEKDEEVHELEVIILLRDESIATLEGQVRKLFTEKQEMEQTFQERERKVGRVHDGSEGIRMQVCQGSLATFTYIFDKSFHFCIQ